MFADPMFFSHAYSAKPQKHPQARAFIQIAERKLLVKDQKTLLTSEYVQQ